MNEACCSCKHSLLSLKVYPYSNSAKKLHHHHSQRKKKTNSLKELFIKHWKWPNVHEELRPPVTFENYVDDGSYGTAYDTAGEASGSRQHVLVFIFHPLIEVLDAPDDTGSRETEYCHEGKSNSMFSVGSGFRHCEKLVPGFAWSLKTGLIWKYSIA